MKTKMTTTNTIKIQASYYPEQEFMLSRLIELINLNNVVVNINYRVTYSNGKVHHDIEIDFKSSDGIMMSKTMQCLRIINEFKTPYDYYYNKGYDGKRLVQSIVEDVQKRIDKIKGILQDEKVIAPDIIYILENKIKI
jgi:hypothetical protein